MVLGRDFPEYLTLFVALFSPYRARFSFSFSAYNVKANSRPITMSLNSDHSILIAFDIGR